MTALHKELIAMTERAGGKETINKKLKYYSSIANPEDSRLFNEMINCFNSLYIDDPYIKDYTVNFREVYRDTLECLFRYEFQYKCTICRAVIDIIVYKLDHVQPLRVVKNS